MVLPLLVNVARGGVAFNAIGTSPILKIHPAVGVARVGDSPSAFFIGPEVPFAGPVGRDASAGSNAPPFRDAGGQIKRQAARFRIFNYLLSGGVEELTVDHPQVAEIEWTVHLVNRKAAFFQFKGQTGAAGPYAGTLPPLRNPSITGAPRATRLVIDPGARSIKGASATSVNFDASKGNIPKDSAGKPIINFLGELQTDDKGRLLVLGGRGLSVSSDALPPDATQMKVLKRGGFGGPAIGAGRPPAPLLEYANNDTWFDDISDGPVTAKVKLKTGKTLTVQFPAWVLVGPPDFAPGVRNVISLYDTMLDVAVRKLPLPKAFFYSKFELDALKGLKDSVAGKAGFQPDFEHDIQPTLRAGFDARFVHAPVRFSHTTIDTANLTGLSDRSGASQALREGVFSMLRPPAGNKNYSGLGSMPKLFGDKYDLPLDVKQVAAVTETQFHILKLWKDGKFNVSFGPPAPAPTVTVDGLDRAALESCVGGAFFPGIECSWLVREKDLYLEPFRIKHGAKVGALTVGPGFFSQQMALPWQADFMDCTKDDGVFALSGGPTVFYGWWPAQRPDDVYRNTADAQSQSNMVEWHRSIPAANPPGQSHANMVANWNKLGFVVSATAGGSQVFIESERTLP